MCSMHIVHTPQHHIHHSVTCNVHLFSNMLLESIKNQKSRLFCSPIHRIPPTVIGTYNPSLIQQAQATAMHPHRSSLCTSASSQASTVFALVDERKNLRQYKLHKVQFIFGIT